MMQRHCDQARSDTRRRARTLSAPRSRLSHCLAAIPIGTVFNGSRSRGSGRSNRGNVGATSLELCTGVPDGTVRCGAFPHRPRYAVTGQADNASGARRLKLTRVPQMPNDIVPSQACPPTLPTPLTDKRSRDWTVLSRLGGAFASKLLAATRSRAAAETKRTRINLISMAYEIVRFPVLTAIAPYVECASLLTAPKKSEAAQPVP